MKLRDLLKRAGNLARLLPDMEVRVYSRSVDNDEFFVTKWVDDGYGSGPLYEYNYGEFDWLRFLLVPKEGEPNPDGIKSVNIDWDSEDFIIDPDDLARLERELDCIEDDMEQVKEAQK